jgi:hypothetical protein
VVGGRPVTIVGVTPPSFFGIEVGRNFDIVLPFCAAAVSTLQRRDQFWLGAVGRLRPGWSVERAARYLETVSSGWFAAVPPGGYDGASMETWDSFRLTAIPFANGLSGLRADYETSLWLLLGITRLVLLVACATS